MNTTPDKPREESMRPPETTPKPTTESRPTIFDRQETVSRTVEWEDTPEARLHDVLDIAFPELTPDQRHAATEIAQRGDRIAFDALADTITDNRLRREVAKASALALNRGITGASLIDRVRLFFTTQRANEAGIGLARALRWLGANTGRTDLRVVYPASGSDRTGFLDHIGQSPVSSIDCITLAGPQGADQKARRQGKEAHLIAKEFSAAISGGDVLPNTADCVVLDTTGLAILADASTHDGDSLTTNIDRILAPGGMIVAGAGYMAVGGDRTIVSMLQDLPPDRYRLVGKHGSVVIIERKPITTEERS